MWREDEKAWAEQKSQLIRWQEQTFCINLKVEKKKKKSTKTQKKKIKRQFQQLIYISLNTFPTLFNISNN